MRWQSMDLRSRGVPNLKTCSPVINKPQGRVVRAGLARQAEVRQDPPCAMGGDGGARVGGID